MAKASNWSLVVRKSGSELAWEGVYIPRTENQPVMSAGISVGTFRYLTSWQSHPSLTLADMHFDDAEFKKITTLHNLFDATDPDLSRFAGLSHKLIIWHGWADPHISPLNSIAYYEAMQRTLGEQRVNDFARLYLFPGGYHCGGGDGPFNMDLLTPMMQWVESGIAPDKIVASHSIGGGGPGGPPPGGRPPTIPLTVDRTRPVFPYPTQAKYSGKGSIDTAANFVPVKDTELQTKDLRWAGQSFYSPGYET